MGNEVTVKLASDNASLDSGLDRAQRKISSFAKQGQRDLSSLNDGGGFGDFAAQNGRAIGRIGKVGSKVAMNIDKGGDVFNSLAGGGAKLASLLGPAGGIVAGGLLVGTVLHRMAEEGAASFDKLIQRSEELKKTNEELVESGGMHELVKGYKELSLQSDELEKKAKSLGTAWGTAKHVLAFLGTHPADLLSSLSGDPTRLMKDMGKDVGKLAGATGTTNTGEIEVRERLREISSQELQIQKLKNEGNIPAAEALQREFALRKSIAEIQHSKLPADDKAALIADLKEINRLENDTATQAAAKKAEKELQDAFNKTLEEQIRSYKEIKELKEHVADAKISGLSEADAYAAREDRMKGLYERHGIKQQTPAALEKDAQSKESAGRLDGDDGAKQEYKDLAELYRLNREQDEDSKRMGKQANDASEKQDKVRLAREEYDIELQLAQARINSVEGDQSAVNALQDKLSVLKQEKTLKEQLGTDDATALANATALVTAERALQTAQNARANKARGDDNAVTHARAIGQTTKADQLERNNAIDKAAEEIQKTNPGMSKAEARRQATTHQNDLDRIAGKPVITRGYTGPSGIATGHGLDDFYKANPRLDAANHGRHLGPPASAKQAVQQNAANAAAKAGDPHQQLLQQQLTVLQQLQQQLIFAN